MEISPPYLLLLVLALLLILFNSLLSKEIYYWVPTTTHKILLWLLVWCVPVLGFFLANKLGKLEWFKTNKSSDGSSAISGGLLQADAVFNPGARNTIEMVEKQKAEVHAEQQSGDSQKLSDKK